MNLLERTWPLALKIALPLVGVSLAAAWLLALIMTGAARESFARTYAAQAVGLAQLVGNGYSKDPQDQPAITTLLTDIWASVPSVRRIDIYRNDGDGPALWASTDPGDIGRYQPTPAETAPLTTGVGSQLEEAYKGERVLETIEPVRLGARQIVASVGMFTSLREREEAVAAVNRRIALFAALGVTCELVAVWAILFWLVLRRTARLSRIASQVARGDLSIRLPEGQEATGTDELFTVAREFDHMLGAVRVRTSQQAALTALGQRALEGTDLASLMEEAVRLVAHNLDADCAGILKLLPGTEGLRLIAGVGWNEGIVGQATAPLGHSSLAGYTLESDEPLIVNDLQTETRFAVPPTLREHGLRSSLDVVIPGQGGPFGVLGAHRRRPTRFTPDDVHFLQAIANTLGWTIRHKYAQEQLREARILEMVAKNEPLENILNTLTEMVESQRPGSLCTVQLAKDGCLHHAAGRRLPPEFVSATDGVAIGPAAGAAALAVTQREAVTIPDLQSAAPDDGNRLALSHGLRACWAVPIASGGGPPLGAFVAYYREPKTPTAEDLRLIGAAGYLATIGIEQRSLVERLAHQAQHDTLTGLPNRILFEDRLQQALAHARRTGDMVGLLFADLDNFKRVNDTLGHRVGDVLLEYVAQRLLARIRQTDTLARMGGDEFAVILTGLNDPTQAAEVAQKLLAALQSAFAVEGYQLFLNGSVGISLFPQDGVEAAVLQRNADTAMYRAKAAGSGFQFFTPEMHAEALERLELDSTLRRAVEQEEFRLHYQPVFDVVTQRFVALEALLRWEHPKLGMVPLAKFIPLAEESGLIVPIGTWVLREACRQNAAWQQVGHPPLRVAVNVSALQFARADFVDTVSRTLADSGLEPRWLELELTESVIMRDVEQVRLRLAQLRALGVHIAIDDFGTGYSSLAYLQQLPIDSLKIDRSFIRDLTQPAATAGPGQTLVRTIVAMAHGLGMQVVAEGVETKGQLEFLQTVGCERGQGFLVARPMPAEITERAIGRRGATDQQIAA